MEILNTETIGKPVFVLVVCFIAATLALLMICTMLFLTEFDAEGVWFVFIFSLIALVTGFAYSASEPQVKYEVIIHDFNEVYEQGYEVIDQRGDLYIIQESEEATDE